MIGCVLILLSTQIAFGDWKKQESGTLAWLRAVHFISEDAGWVVGSNGTLLATDDGGEKWTAVKKLPKDNFRDVYFADSMNGWILAERDVYRVGTAAVSYLLETVDGGDTWERVEFSRSRERATGFLFANGKRLIFGEAGTIWRFDKGSDWRREELPVKNIILDAYFTDANTGVLTGTTGTVLFTQDGGATWNSVSIPEGGAVRLNSVEFVSELVGWAAGGNGSLYSTKNGGRSWLRHGTTSNLPLTDIKFADDRRGFAVGGNGTVLETVDGGATWTGVTRLTPHRLERLFLSGRRAWAVGFGGTILALTKD